MKNRKTAKYPTKTFMSKTNAYGWKNMRKFRVIEHRGHIFFFEKIMTKSTLNYEVEKKEFKYVQRHSKC